MPPEACRSHNGGRTGSPVVSFFAADGLQRHIEGGQGDTSGRMGINGDPAETSTCNQESITNVPGGSCQPVPADIERMEQIWDRWWTGDASCGPPNADPPTCEDSSFSRLSLRHGVSEDSVASHVKNLRSCLLHSIGKTETSWSFLTPFRRKENYEWARVTPKMTECFSVVKHLGRGECGDIQLCEELDTGHRFACKTICKSALKTEDDINEVCSEILTMLKLQSTKSKHLINIHEVFDDEDAIHLILDYCDGGDLLEYINKHERLTEEQAAHILKQVVKGVMAMHSKGVVHRDLKPENILICTSKTGPPRVKVADFGLSVELQGAMKAVGTAGSLHYMAPEVVASRCYGRKVDVWSLGVVLFVCLSGKLPFQGKSEEAIRRAICRAKPCLRQKPWNEVSQEAKALLLWMLHPKREERMPLAEVLSQPWFQLYAPDSE